MWLQMISQRVSSLLVLRHPCLNTGRSAQGSCPRHQTRKDYDWYNDPGALFDLAYCTVLTTLLDNLQIRDPQCYHRAVQHLAGPSSQIFVYRSRSKPEVTSEVPTPFTTHTAPPPKPSPRKPRKPFEKERWDESVYRAVGRSPPAHDCEWHPYHTSCVLIQGIDLLAQTYDLHLQNQFPQSLRLSKFKTHSTFGIRTSCRP